MKLRQFIDQHILSNLYPDEKLLLNVDYNQNIPYGIDWNDREIPEDSRELERLHDVILKGTLASGAYFCTATHRIEWYKNTEHRPNDAWHGVYRGKRLARRWLCFVADDVYTKVPLRNLRGMQPTFIIETSLGNYQYVYVFEEPIDDMTLAMAFLQQARALKLTDAGGLITTKLVRLPTGMNIKEKYLAQNQLWNGERYWKVEAKMVSGKRYDIFELAQGFGMDVHALSMSKQADVGYASADVLSMKPNRYADVEQRMRAQRRRQNEWGLKVLAELTDNNMVKTPVDQIEARRLDQGGYIDIHCPWEHEHSGGGEYDGQGDAQFSPVGFGPTEYVDDNQFVCRHDHCAGRNIGHLKAYALEQGWINDEDLADKSIPSFDQKLIETVANKVFIPGRNPQVVDIRYPHAEPWGMDSLNGVLASWEKPYDKGRKVLALSTAWKKHPQRKVAASKEFIPGRGPLVKDDESDLAIFNLWQPSRLRPKPCSDRLRQALDDHFQCITGNTFECKWAKAFTASCIVHPEIRLLIAWLSVCEAEGTGRGTVFKIVRALSGPRTVKTVTSEIILKADFNAWCLGATFIHVPEFLIANKISKTQRELMDSLKQVVSEPELEINQKGVATQQHKVHAMMFLASNHPDAIAINTSDRRFLVTYCDTDPLGGEHYDYLNDCLANRDMLEQMLGYFTEVDEQYGAEIRAMKRAPMTEGKQTMIEESKTSIDHAVHTLINSTEPMPWATPVLAAAIRKICSRSEEGAMYKTMGNRELMRRAAHTLKDDHGYRSGGAKVRKWITPKIPIAIWYDPDEPTQLTEAWSAKRIWKANIDAVAAYWGEAEQVALDHLKGHYGAELANELWNSSDFMK